MPSHCGCRQVVRPELPKLVFAGSNPVTRSSFLLTPSNQNERRQQ